MKDKHCKKNRASQGAQKSTCQCRRHGFHPLGGEDPLEKGMATHSSVPAWRIPWTEEPGKLQSTGSRSM